MSMKGTNPAGHRHVWPCDGNDFLHAALNSSSSPSFFISQRPPETNMIFHIPPPQLSDTVYLCAQCVWEYLYNMCLFMSVCVCVWENLEGHDKVCEVKLGLQVQLDGHILHTCSSDGNTPTQEINN